jgi:hypothetical protein
VLLSCAAVFLPTEVQVQQSPKSGNVQSVFHRLTIDTEDEDTPKRYQKPTKAKAPQTSSGWAPSMRQAPPQSSKPEPKPRLQASILVPSPIPTVSQGLHWLVVGCSLIACTVYCKSSPRVYAHMQHSRGAEPIPEDSSLGKHTWTSHVLACYVCSTSTARVPRGSNACKQASVLTRVAAATSGAGGPKQL